MGENNDKGKARDYGYSEHVDVCLIGPSLVGKTSLLATMHQQLQDYLPHNVQFKPLDNELFQMLTNKYRSLERMADVPPHCLAIDDGEGTQQIQTYSFGFNFVTEQGTPDKFLQVNFHDTPGGYTKSLSQELIDKVNSSQIIINAVDAGVMMEASLHAARAFNGYDQVARILEESFVDGRNRLVLFVLTKAETWIADWPEKREAEENPLIRRAGKHLARALKLVAPFDTRLGIVVPVETMGCIRYLTTIPAGVGGKSAETIQYARIPGEFRPRHVDFPLLYTLHFVAAEFYRNRSIFGKLFHRFFGNYTNLLKALEAAEEGMGGHRPPMSVYGNRGLLDSDLGNGKLHLPRVDGDNTGIVDVLVDYPPPSAEGLR